MKKNIKIAIRVIAIILMLSAFIFGAIVFYVLPVTSVVAWIGFSVMLIGFCGVIHHALI